MEKINLLFFYQLGATLRPLTEMEAKDSMRVNIWIASFAVEKSVRDLLDLFSTLTVCRGTAGELISAIKEAGKWMRETPGKEWEKKDYSADANFQQVINKSKEFETVLSAELQTLATYHVTQKGIYSTTSLIDGAEKTLPEPVLKKISPDTIEEIRQSGRCLAFDNATASAFHIIRATEAVLHKYYISVCKPKSKNKLDNWGAYISALHKLSEDPTVKKAVGEDVKKVEALLQQIKDQDRNLVMHPEVVLSPDEAFTLFEIAKGAIMAMAKMLPAGKKK